MKSDSLSDILLLISVKPKFAKKIFKGEKTVELRKSAPKRAKKGTHLLIYVTSPVKELWGICRIENIIKDSPRKLWQKVGKNSGISYDEFFSYYQENNNAYGIEISNVQNFMENSIKLEYLKDMFPGFAPPQTYRYFEEKIISASILSKMID